MMRYAALDIETTGLDHERCQVLEIGCVIETDWRTPVEQLPTFRAVCNPGVITGDATALWMNARLLQEVAGTTAMPLNAHVIDLYGFLNRHLGDAKVTFAGKNFGKFDYHFLRRASEWDRLIKHRHRFIDVGNLWWNPLTDTLLPSLEECHARAGLAPREWHGAVEDCRGVIECVRARFTKGGA